MRVADVMSHNPVTIGPDRSIRDAADLLVRHRISGLPVVEETGRLAGIVTEADLVAREAERSERQGRRRKWSTLARTTREPAGATVDDVMTTAVVTIGPDDSVAAAARCMTELGVKRLPVVDDDGRLVGIISRVDVVRSFLRPDPDIAEDVEDLVARMPIDAGGIALTVEDGVVQLFGEVENHSDAALLSELASRLDGVVRVDSELTWRVDDRIEAEPWSGYPREGMSR